MMHMTHKQRVALLATIIGSGVVFLDGSIVNLALPKMAADFHASFADLQWVMSAYLLSLSALMLLGGSLGDIFGRKRIYLIGVAGFTIASLMCALAPTIEWLIFTRIVQGACGALMVPGALAIIDTNFVATLRSKAIGLWTAWTAAITAIGPLAGGYLVDVSSWRWVFVVNAPLLALCLWLAYRGVVESKDEEKRHIDFRGAAVAILALGGIVFGLIEGAASGWTLIPIVSLIGGIVLSIIFVWLERWSKDPMLKMRLFKNANFTGTNITTFAMYGAAGGFFFVLPIQLQEVVGFSSLQAGMSLLPATIILLSFSSRVGVLASKFGPRLFMTLGPILAGCSILLLFSLHAGSEFLLHILPGVVLFAIGMTLTVTPLTMTVLNAVAEADAGIASAVNNAVSRVAGLLVIALVGLLGASFAYQFATISCGVLAIVAGMLSFFVISNKSIIKSS